MRTGRTTKCCPAVDRVAGAMARRRDCLRVLSAIANASSTAVCHIQHCDLTMLAGTRARARETVPTNYLRRDERHSSAAADEVLLADVDAVVAENRVRGRDMEKDVRDRPALHEVESLEVEELVGTGGNFQVALFGTLRGAVRNALQIVDGAGDARAQLLNRLLVVLETRRLEAREASHGILRQIAGDLDLA